MQRRFTFLTTLPFGAALMAFWLVMSGSFSAVFITMGVISVILVLLFNRRLRSHAFLADERAGLGGLRFFPGLYYIAWLSGQVVLAGLHVAAVLLRRRMQIEPAILRFRVDLPSAQAKVILGNSITLTPGTLTIDISGNEFVVHALTEASAAGLVNDSMPRQVLRLFSNESHPVISDLRIAFTAVEMR